MTNYLLGVATPILFGYIGFGAFIMKEQWRQHPSEHWKAQYRNPYTKPPLLVRSWSAFLALWLPTPLLWPLTIPIGKLAFVRYRHAHNKAAERAGLAST